MSATARYVMTSVGLALGAFLAGTACTLLFYPQMFGTTAEEDPHDHAADDESDHEQVLALSRPAFENLGLTMGHPTRGEYWKTVAMPGEVVEIPGKSDLSISAPVSGIVREVLVMQGQALGPADRLVSLHITDDKLTEAQSELLATLSRQSVVQQEIDRLAPLVESGAVSGKRVRDMEYEMRQLESTVATLMQEIRARGLPEEALQQVVEQKRLATDLAISVPSFMQESTSAFTVPVSHVTSSRPLEFSIEELYVHPGKSVQKGEDLANLAYHAELYIEGLAFESDLPALSEVSEHGWPIRAEFGHNISGDHSHAISMEDLQLLHIDNHVDHQTQTFRFYLSLENNVVESRQDDLGRVFQQWKFKPGQRIHLQVPVSRWQNQLLLPRDAVAVQGPFAIVFVEHHHDDDHAHDHDDDHAHEEDDHPHPHEDAHSHPHPHDESDHADVFVELEPVQVQLLYRDDQMAVIADDGTIHLDDELALNAAYKLYLALQIQQSGGSGGHSHEH